MNKRVYRAAILGMGGMGRAHADNLRAMGDVELAALCSTPVADAKAYKEQNNLSSAIYEDGFEMIEKESLDILYVCLPPFAHTGQIEAAAAKGIHIFAEKPLALTVERAESMAEAARKAGIYTQMGYQMRFGGAVQELKKRIEDGTAGAPTLFTARYECNSLHKPWWIDVNQCGGQVFEQVIHLYDMSMHFMGRPETVCGFTANLQHQDVPGYTVEDTSVSAIRYQSGALGSISGSNCAIPGRWLGMFRVVCEHLVADFADCNKAEFTYMKNGKPFCETLSYDTLPRKVEDEYFLEVVRGNKPPFATFEEGLAGLKMVSGVVDSSGAGGAPISVG